jgi:hypothetical protein
MKILDIYRKYKIMPSLQLHMLRVAGVSTIICDNFQGFALDKTSIVTSSLLHDMGNIIKFDLTKFPEFLKPKGLDYWQEIKKEFIEQYGDNESVASELIAEEIGVSPQVKKLIQATSMSSSEQNFLTKDFGKKICDYADNIIGPFGVLSLEGRLLDFKKRYQDQFPADKDRRNFELLSKYAREVEQQIFEHCRISPEEITNESVSDTIDSLKSFVVPKRPQ